MATPYNGNPAGPINATVTLPDDGEKVTAASVNIAFQPTRDDIAYINAHASVAAFATHQLTGNPWNETVANDGAFHDTGAILDFTSCKIGDLIVVSWSGAITTGGTGSGGLRVGFRDDFAGTNVLVDTATIQWSSAITSRPTSNFSAHAVTVAGTTRVVIRLEASGAANITMDGVGTLLATRTQTNSI